MKLKLIVSLILITILGGFLRFDKLTENPTSLNIDEVSYGYDAYSILKTGRDQNGNFMPVIFKSVGDYKNPVLIYLTVPSIAVFGLNEFGVRFPTALFGTLSIPLLFFLAKTLTKNVKLSVVSTLLLSISPWHIYYSRLASDTLLGLFFVMLGVLFFQKMIENGKYFLLAALFLSISVYTYHSERLFVPLLIFFWLLIKYRDIGLKKIGYFLLCSLILMLPLIYFSLLGQANFRATMVILTQDIEYTRYVVLDHSYRQPQTLLSNEILLLPFFTINRYLGYFQPEFLVFDGLNVSKSNFGLGVLYLFELPWLILGLVKLIKNKLPGYEIILAWLLLGFIPAAITNNVTSSGRSLLNIPPLIFISALGAMNFFAWINNQSGKLKRSLLLFYSLLIIITLINAVLMYSVHFPVDRDEAFMQGTKASVLYALKHKNEYQEIVYDPKRGVEAGDVINIPHMYILFYSKYDPATYQKQVTFFAKNGAHFDKFTIRPINWQYDRYKKGVLFIGSPWSLPQKDIAAGEILDRIYLHSGSLALLIVTP